MAKTNRKIPVKRINKFFSSEDYKLEIQMAREAIEGDGNFTVILYKVDKKTSQYDDLYNEANANELNFLPPVELYVSPLIAPPENKTYNKSSLRYLEDGHLAFTVYQDHLEELNVDIEIGDYIAYPVSATEVIYFNVANAGEKNYFNEATIMGYLGPYRMITCAPVNPDEFQGI